MPNRATVNPHIILAVLRMPEVFPLFPLKFNNRGSAPLDIETTRIRDDQPVDAAANLVGVRSDNAGTLNTGADGKAVFIGLRVYQTFCLLLMAVGVAQAQNIVSPEELKNMLAEKKKVEVVDVRPADQFFARHMDGAINVPLADVKAHKFPKKKALVLYCGGTDCSYKAA